jgi:hypothetical protein
MKAERMLAGMTLFLVVVTVPQAVSGATLAYATADVFHGPSCSQQTTTSAHCFTLTSDPDLNGTAQAFASAALFSLYGYVDVFASPPVSHQAPGSAEFKASFSGLVTITGGVGSAFLLTRVDQTSGGAPIDLTIIQGSERLDGQVGSGSFEMFSPFTFGVPFPLSAEIRSDAVPGGESVKVFAIGTLDLSFVGVEDSSGVPIAAQFSFADAPPAPIPEVQSAWLLLSGLLVVRLIPAALHGREQDR